MKSLEIDIEEYKTNKVSKDISNLIQELEDKSIVKPNTPLVQTLDNNRNTATEAEKSDQENISTNTNEDEIKTEDLFLKEVEDLIAISYKMIINKK